MFALGLVVTVILFVAGDVVVRKVMQWHQEQQRRRERAEALAIGLKLDFAAESPSLKRVTVSEPGGSILAVDDEPVVLDSFRKILVLDGYSVDTVESGPEALALIRDRRYDFLFTDLKMPGMDGIEVVKAAKHLRPDTDVIVITGYATVESAVECMKYGALDYVQKPFTEDELRSFVGKCRVIREARLAERVKPKIQLVTAAAAQSRSERVFNVPAGLFVSPAHLWLNLLPSGELRIGVDDFAQKVIGRIDQVQITAEQTVIKKGATLFELRQRARRLVFPAPLSGKVTAVNAALLSNPELIQANPYEGGWVCRLEAEQLAAELHLLRIGSEACDWYRAEVDRLLQHNGGCGSLKPLAESDEDAWRCFQQEFLRQDERGAKIGAGS